MFLKATGGVIADCGLTRQNVNAVDEIEIGYHVRHDLWGRGLAPEAAGACRGYGFERLGAERLISLIRPENWPSRRGGGGEGGGFGRGGVWWGLARGGC